MARLEVIIKKRSSAKIVVEEMWVTEKETREDLKWSPSIASILCIPCVYKPYVQSVHPAVFQGHALLGPRRSASKKLLLIFGPSNIQCAKHVFFESPFDNPYISETLPTPACRKNLYDGMEEYCVVVKERGCREVEESHEESRRSTTALEAPQSFFEPGVKANATSTVLVC